MADLRKQVAGQGTWFNGQFIPFEKKVPEYGGVASLVNPSMMVPPRQSPVVAPVPQSMISEGNLLPSNDRNAQVFNQEMNFPFEELIGTEMPYAGADAATTADPMWDTTKKVLEDNLTEEGRFRKAAEEAANPAPEGGPGIASLITDAASGAWDWVKEQDAAVRKSRKTAAEEAKKAETKAVEEAKKEVDAGTVTAPTPAGAIAPGGGVVTDVPIDEPQAGMEDYFSLVDRIFPPMDNTNPKQDIADQNAERDRDKTALLAQLAIAGGMVAGAGKSYEGMGQGFLNAAGAYDDGFKRYQNALQDSADRYAKDRSASQSYDIAKRTAALDLYTGAGTERRSLREEARLLMKERREQMEKMYEPYFKMIEGDDGSMVSMEDKERMARGVSRAMEESYRTGRFVIPGPDIKPAKEET